jgi:hypothetical protein
LFRAACSEDEASVVFEALLWSYGRGTWDAFHNFVLFQILLSSVIYRMLRPICAPYDRRIWIVLWKPCSVILTISYYND